MEDICREIGARLRALRRDRGYTLTEFAEIVHRSKSTLSKYERGEIAVDVATLDELARALDKSAAELFYAGAPGVSFAEAPEERLEDMQRYYLYMYGAHEGRPWVARNALFLGEGSAHIYSELPNDEDIYAYRSCYMGVFRKTNSFARVIAVNPLHADDVLMLNYELTLKPAKAFTGFLCTMSIGHWFPLALPVIISSVPIADEAWLKARLAFTARDLRAFKSVNAFFHRTRPLDAELPPRP